MCLLNPLRKQQPIIAAVYTQMAARETGFGAVEQYMHAGKLLALELLVRVLENPHHHWSALRPEVRNDCIQMCLVTRWQRTVRIT